MTDKPTKAMIDALAATAVTGQIPRGVRMSTFGFVVRNCHSVGGQWIVKPESVAQLKLAEHPLMQWAAWLRKAGLQYTDTRKGLGLRFRTGSLEITIRRTGCSAWCRGADSALAQAYGEILARQINRAVYVYA